MRKNLVILLILAILTSCTACSSNSNSANTNLATPDPTMWYFNENDIDQEREHLPKAFYNPDGSVKTDEEISQTIYHIERKDSVNSETLTYEVVNLNTTKYLQASEEGLFYFIEPELIERYKNGEWIDQLRLLRVFLDKDDVPRCHEYILKREAQYMKIYCPQSTNNQVWLQASTNWIWCSDKPYNPNKVIIFFSLEALK